MLNLHKKLPSNDNHGWLITLIDLILLLICFFVLSFAINMNKVEVPEKLSLPYKYVAKAATLSASQSLIYKVLNDKIHSPNIKIVEGNNENPLRIEIDLENDNPYEINQLINEINHALFHITKNPIKISLMLNINAILSLQTHQNKLIRNKTLNLLDYSMNLRSLLAASHKEVSNVTIKMDAETFFQTNRLAKLIVDIITEPN